MGIRAGILGLVLIATSANAQYPIFLDADPSTGFGINRIAVAPDGSLHFAAGFFGTHDLDPGPGTTIVSSDARTFYFATLDPEGWFQRAFATEAIDTEYPSLSALAAHPDGGFVAAGYGGLMDFDPGPGTHVLSSYETPFLVRYDADGVLVSGVEVGTVLDEDGYIGVYGMALDGAETIWICGLFEGTVDFDAGPGEAIHSAQAWRSAYWARFDEEGTFQEVHVLHSDFRVDALGMRIDPAGGLALRFRSHGLTDLDPGPGEYLIEGLRHAIARYSDEGALLDVLLFAERTSTGSIEVADFDVDAEGHTVAAGNFSGTPDFDPGEGTTILEASGTTTGFIARYDETNTPQFVIPLGGTRQYAITTDYTDYVRIGDEGEVYATGSFIGEVDFDPGPGTFILGKDAEAGPPSYVCRYSEKGELDFAFLLGPGGMGYTLRFELAPASRFLVQGKTGSDPIDFDPGPGELIFELDTLTPFIARYEGDGRILVGNDASPDVSTVWPGAVPNPFVDHASVTLTPTASGPVRIDLYDILGRHLETLYQREALAGQPVHVRLDGARLAPGTYLIRTTSPDGIATTTLTKAR